MVLSKKIIAYGIQDKSCLARIASELEVAYFVDSAERNLFEILKSHFLEFTSKLSFDALEQIGENESSLDGDEQHACEKLYEEAVETDVDTEDFERDMKLFRENFIQQAFQRTFEGGLDEAGNFQPGILDLGETNPRKAYDRIVSALGPLMSDHANKGLVERVTVHEGMEEVIKQYEELVKDPTKAFGIKTGYKLIDEATLGIRGGEMFVVGGRPGQGKSIFLLNMAVNAFRKGHDVMIISIEMPKKQYLERFAACYSNIPLDGLQNGSLTSEDEKKLKETWNDVQTKAARKENLHIISIPIATAATVEAEINRLNKAIREGKMRAPEVLIVDYLGIMRSIDKSVGTADWQDQGTICEELRLLARRRSLPVITAIQLNRDKQKSKGTSRIARSDIIAATVDVFLQIEEEGDDPDALPADDVMKIYVGKNRKGVTDKSFSLWKNFGNMLIRNRDAGKPRDPMASFNNLEQQVIDTANDNLEPEESPDMEK